MALIVQINADNILPVVVILIGVNHALQPHKPQPPPHQHPHVLITAKQRAILMVIVQIRQTPLMAPLGTVMILSAVMVMELSTKQNALIIAFAIKMLLTAVPQKLNAIPVVQVQGVLALQLHQQLPLQHPLQPQQPYPHVQQNALLSQVNVLATH